MSTLLHSGEGSRIERTVLPGGIRIITETVPGLASETVAVWVGSGSRHEAEGSEGSTHFLEHMLFKGTATRSAHEIARGLERTGGDSNALTAKEHTCYYARCLVADLADVTELLWDMVLESQLDPAEFERERGVIVEELAMAADDPTDQLYEDYEQLIYAGQPLGRPVGATKEQIRLLDHGVLLDHYAHAYAGPGLVFSAAGGATHEEVVEQVTRFAEASLSRRTQLAPAAAPAVPPAAAFTPGRHVRVRETEQQGMLLGTQGLPDGHEKRFVNIVLANLLGGGMSSRLFQTIREQHGLAYTVHTVLSEYSDVGTFAVYAGSAPENAQQVLDLVGEELRRIAVTAPSEDEVADVVAQLAGSTVLGMESTAVRMNRIARHELNGLPLLEPDELIARVRAVTPADVQEHARALFSGPWALASVGPRADLVVPRIL